MTIEQQASLQISLFQHRSPLGDIDASLTRLDQIAGESAAHGSSLLITPECGVTGYDLNMETAQCAAFSASGTIATSIAHIAQKHGISILYGYMEADADLRYNSVQLVDATGQSLLRYRKTHLWGDLDRQLFSPGDTLAPVIDFKGWKLSTLICYDVEFPETMRTLALAGAQLVLVPTALMQPFRFVAEHMIPVRAAENQTFVAYANMVGTEQQTVYEGCSTIAAPDGSVLTRASSDEETLLQATLSAELLASTRKALPYHRDRRPSLYRFD